LIQIPKQWLKKYWKLIIFLLPIYSFFVLVITSQNFLLTFKFLTWEDSVVEYLEFFVFGITIFLAASVAFKVYKSKIKDLTKNILLSCFCLIFFGLILITGEEISWGQRIFNIETPEEYAKQNYQKELNIHNNKNVLQYVYVVYALIGIYGGFSWTLRLFLEKKYPKKKITKYLQTITPDWYLMFYFLSVALYALARKKYGIWQFREWEEIVELFLAFGIMFFVLDNQKNLVKRFESLEK
jgi:hypothetical protein